MAAKRSRCPICRKLFAWAEDGYDQLHRHMVSEHGMGWVNGEEKLGNGPAVSTNDNVRRCLICGQPYGFPRGSVLGEYAIEHLKKLGPMDRKRHLVQFAMMQ